MLACLTIDYAPELIKRGKNIFSRVKIPIWLYISFDPIVPHLKMIFHTHAFYTFIICNRNTIASKLHLPVALTFEKCINFPYIYLQGIKCWFSKNCSIPLTIHIFDMTCKSSLLILTAKIGIRCHSKTTLTRRNG